ncbi:unnamed protein product [Cylicocyclus nassatus]|uniref:Doublecortin domain-containing protein n=1 Tax=Cylicocyclus nassatus TaxID=53992 RepID=A0AA36MFY3_CYLNA|nr:unnamed protein product [Cylicocyclus nassatus]
MNSAERRYFELDFTGPKPVDYDYQAKRIRVYKNGSENDPGKLVTVTRREFKHWILFLDALTEKLGTITAVNKLFTTGGIRVEHFNDLENNGEYVAVERGPFIDCNYGMGRVWTQTERGRFAISKYAPRKPMKKYPAGKIPATARDVYRRPHTELLRYRYDIQDDDDIDFPYRLTPLSAAPRYTLTKWTSLVRVTENKPTFLNSGDSMDIYLKKQGYGSTTGLPYPLDGLSRSPNASLMNMAAKEKMGGSMEQLNKATKELWSDEHHSMSMANLRAPPDHSMSMANMRAPPEYKERKKEHSLFNLTSTGTKLPRLIGIENQKLPPRLKENERLPPIKSNDQPPAKTLQKQDSKGEERKATVRDPGLTEERRSGIRDIGRSQAPKHEGKQIEEAKDVMEYSVVDKSMQPWEGTSGNTVYEKKEMMHEVVTKDPGSLRWQDTSRRKKMTEVIRTYEKIREYRRFIDEYDPDFVD